MQMLFGHGMESALSTTKCVWMGGYMNPTNPEIPGLGWLILKARTLQASFEISRSVFRSYCTT